MYVPPCTALDTPKSKLKNVCFLYQFIQVQVFIASDFRVYRHFGNNNDQYENENLFYVLDESAA